MGADSPHHDLRIHDPDGTLPASAMIGFVAVTDFDWYDFLSTHPGLEEVNFWRPSDTRTPHQLQVGSPFAFKLKEEHGGWIVGYGIFASHSVLPAWLAWEAFEEKNGAPDFPSMRRRIERLRREPAISNTREGGYLIGCLMLSRPVFFARDQWIRPPADWPRNAVQGKGYDLSLGEGYRVWSECLARSTSEMPIAQRAEVVESGEAARYGESFLVRPRLGQGIFRVKVTDAYGRACAVTTEHSLPVLEAAHIRPYVEGGEHAVPNGVLLRTDIHRLFDRGYVTITPDCEFLVSGRLRDEYENGKTYYAMQGRIHLPALLEDRPSPALLEWHAREKFLG